MQGIKFSHPTLTTLQMSRQDQIDVSVNQATAAIVCCYLEHMNAAIAKEIFGPGVDSTGFPFITTTEIVTLVNNIQAALRTIP